MENREDRRREVCKVRIWMYGKAISCSGRYLYIERGREKEKEKETKEREREREERAKSAQLMQGRAKLATLGREVSILKKVTLVPGSRRKQERATSVL